MSNDEELDPYCPSIIANKSAETPVVSRTTQHPISFSTFVDGNQRTNSFREFHRDSSL